MCHENEKDAKLYLQAEKRLRPVTVGGIISKQEFKELTKMSRGKNAAADSPPTPDRVDMMLKPYCNEWECQLDVLEEHMIRNKECIEAHKLVTEIIREMQNTMKELGLHLSGHFPITMVRALFHRTLLHSKTQNYQKSIDDATECFKLMRALRGGTAPKGREINLLYFRGICFLLLDDINQAIMDLKGCCAASRLNPLKLYDCVLYTKELVGAMTLEKIRSGASRPHYTSQERDAIEKELGLGIYEVSSYRCSHYDCEKEPSDAVTLMLCDCCNEKWFCSKECTEVAWRGGHRPNLLSPDFMAIEQNEVSSSVIGRDKNAFSVHALNGPAGPTIVSILYDPKTDQYYDSLTDQKVKVYEVEYE